MAARNMNVTGSNLSHQSGVFDSLEFVANLPPSNGWSAGNASNFDLPLHFYERNDMRLPLTNPKEIAFMSTLKLDRQEAAKLERDTVQQGNCDLWFKARKGRLTSSKCHKVITAQSHYQYPDLCREILNPTPMEDFPCHVQESMNYGLVHEPTARKLYIDVMNLKLKRCISVRETGIVVQPSIPWLGASPDGLVIDGGSVGMIEIKCPASKKHSKPSDLLEDPRFYVGYEYGRPVLKKTHRNGY